MAITVEETPDPFRLPDDIAPPVEYSCEVCGEELFYGGRGRKPKFCDEHKKNRPPTSATRTTRSPSVDRLVEQISETYRMVGTGLTFNNGTSMDGMVLLESADKLGESWRTLLERDPKIRKMWEKFFTVSGYGAVLAAHAMIALPIMQNHGLIKRPIAPPEQPAPSAAPQSPWSYVEPEEAE